MGQRADLHRKFEIALGSKNVYFQPPESVKLKYPCIIYGLSKLPIKHADDRPYLIGRAYAGILIDRNLDSKILDTLLKFPLCEFGKPYPADNLNHYPFTIYY